jgi:hypothetical protein
MYRTIGARVARHLNRGLWIGVAILGLVGAVSADPPARVGRLNFLEGSVSFRPAGIEDWSSATINYPVTIGDRVWTDRGSRVELHIGSTAIRLGPQTDFDILNLSDDATQLSLSQGSIIVHIDRLDSDDTFEIDTPNAAVSLLRPGFYRIDVSSDGDNSYVTVRRGQAEVTAEGNAFTVDPNESATIFGVDSVSYDIEGARSLDGWDDWCLVRDRREAQLAAEIARERYVSAEMTGYEDLNGYGRWQVVPDYGTVWVPTRVVAGWAPYRYGHWAWVYPWGWTWVDDAPWGFAPFHYGRWAFVGGTWAWVPGTYVARPVYAPALVAFVGGGGFSLSVFGGGGGVAWFPLGPREVFVPAYRVSPVYVRNVNVTNVNVTNINVTNINVQNVNYVNRGVAGAVTAVPQTAFVGGRAVATSAVQVKQSQIATATVSGTTAAVVPTRASVLAQTTSGAQIALPPQKALKRGIVAKSTVPPPPVAFSTQVQAMQTTRGIAGTPPDPESLKAFNKQQRLEERSVKLATVPTGKLKPAREGITAARPITADTGKKSKGDSASQQGGATTAGQTDASGAGRKDKDKNKNVTGNPTGQTGQTDTEKNKNKPLTTTGQPTGNPSGKTVQTDTEQKQKQKNKQVTDTVQSSGKPTGQSEQPDSGQKHKEKAVTGTGQPTGNPPNTGGGQPAGKVKQKDKVQEPPPDKNKDKNKDQNKKPKEEKEKNP